MGRTRAGKTKSKDKRRSSSIIAPASREMRPQFTTTFTLYYLMKNQWDTQYTQNAHLSFIFFAFFDNAGGNETLTLDTAPSDPIYSRISPHTTAFNQATCMQQPAAGRPAYYPSQVFRHKSRPLSSTGGKYKYLTKSKVGTEMGASSCVDCITLLYRYRPYDIIRRSWYMYIPWVNTVNHIVCLGNRLQQAFA
jgi:hypothetical protein